MEGGWGLLSDFTAQAFDQFIDGLQRDAFEFPLVRKALEADLPLLTTCRGTQLLSVALGGTLCMDVPSLGAAEGMVGHCLVAGAASLICVAPSGG